MSKKTAVALVLILFSHMAYGNGFFGVFSGSIGKQVYDTGLSVIDVPSGAIKVCGLQNTDVAQEFDLLKIANQLKCDEKTDLKEHCACVSQYSGSELKKGERDDLEAELGFLAQASSSAKQKVLNELGNATEVIANYVKLAPPRLPFSCLDDEKMKAFEEQAKTSLDSSIASKKDIPSLARKDFYNQAKNVSNVLITPKDTRLADVALLNDLISSFAKNSANGDIEDLSKAPPKLILNNTKYSIMYSSFSSAINAESSELVYDYDKSTDVYKFLSNPDTDLNKYKDSPLFKVFAQTSNQNKLNMADMIGRMALAKEHFKSQERDSKSSIKNGFDKELWALSKAAEVVPVNDFLKAECDRVAENVKFEATTNYYNGKFQAEMVETKKLMAERAGEVLLSPLEGNLDPKTDEGRGNIEALNNLRKQFSESYKESLSHLDEDSQNLLLTEKKFRFSKLVCGKVKQDEEIDKIAKQIEESSDSERVLGRLERASNEVKDKDDKIDAYKLELISIDRASLRHKQNLNLLQSRKETLEKQITDLEQLESLEDDQRAQLTNLKFDLAAAEQGIRNSNESIDHLSKQFELSRENLAKAKMERAEIFTKLRIPPAKRKIEVMTEESLAINPSLEEIKPIEIAPLSPLEKDRPMNIPPDFFKKYKFDTKVIDPVNPGDVAVLVPTIEKVDPLKSKKEVFVVSPISGAMDEISLGSQEEEFKFVTFSEMQRSKTSRETVEEALLNETDISAADRASTIAAASKVLGGSIDTQSDVFSQGIAVIDQNGAAVLEGREVAAIEARKTRDFARTNAEDLYVSTEITERISQGMFDPVDETEVEKGISEIAQDYKGNLFTKNSTRSELRRASENLLSNLSGSGGIQGGVLAAAEQARQAQSGDLLEAYGNVDLNSDKIPEFTEVAGSITSRTLGTRRALSDSQEDLGVALATGIKNANGIDKDADKVMQRAQELLAERGYDLPSSNYSSSKPKTVTKKSLKKEKAKLKRKNKIKKQIARDMQIENIGMARETEQAKSSYSALKEQELPTREVAFDKRISKIGYEEEKAPQPVVEENSDRVGAPAVASMDEIFKPAPVKEAPVSNTLGKKIEREIAKAQEVKAAQKNKVTTPKRVATSKRSSSTKSSVISSAPVSVSTGGSSAGGASARPVRGPASVSGELARNSFDLNSSAAKAFNPKKYELTPILDGVDDALYVRIPSFEAPEDFLTMPEKLQEEWVNKQFEESEAIEAVVSFSDGKKLLVKKKLD